MSYPAYTLGELKTLALQRADMVNSEFVDATEQARAIDRGVALLSDLLLSIQGGQLWAAKTDLVYSQGLGDTGIATGLPPIYKLLKVGLYFPRNTTTGHITWLEPAGAELVRSLRSRTWSEDECLPRYLFTMDRSFAATTSPSTNTLSQSLVLLPPPNTFWRIRIEFFPLFNFGTASDSARMQLPFPEYVILSAAIAFATKEQNSELVALLNAELTALEQRIRLWASPIDRSQPGFMTDMQGDLDLGLESGLGEVNGAAGAVETPIMVWDQFFWDDGTVWAA